MKSSAAAFGKGRARALWIVVFILLPVAIHAANLTTTNSQSGTNNWNLAIWRASGGNPVAPAAGNTYEAIFNGFNIGDTNGSNTIVQSPAVFDLQTFPGNSLTFDANTELIFRQSGSVPFFPVFLGNPGLVLKGAMLSVGDDATISVTGLVQIASTSFISQGTNGGVGAIAPNRAINLAGQLTGPGDLVILLSGTNVPQQISYYNNNAFTGQWIVQCGWLQGTRTNSLGTNNNIIVDPLYSNYLATMPFFQSTNGGAWFEPNYDLNTAGMLVLTNGGLMILHQNCAFSSVFIEGTQLTNGVYPYSVLASNFPNNFAPGAPGGIGSITVQPYGPLPSFAPEVLQQPTPSAAGFFNKGSASFTAAFIGTPRVAYKWRFTTNGTDYTDVAANATNTTLLISNLQPANAGFYSLWASNVVTGDYTIGTTNAQLIWQGPAPALKPFPIGANGRATVTCLDFPAVTYDIYLPPGYSTNGPPLPILYTLAAGGGGLVTMFQSIGSSMNMIVVGVISSANSSSWTYVMRDFYAVPRDIRKRVLFDPNSQFVTGESGGGDNAYFFSRFWAQHVSGMFAMSGWMGRVFGGPAPVYYNSDHVLTNLLVARSTGTNDASTQINFKPFDGAFVVSCGAVLKDWWFAGGHTYAPDNLKITALNWLVANRTPAGIYDASNAMAMAADWRTRAASGDGSAVLHECVSNILSHPRTWYALEGQMVMDDLMTNYNSFRSLDVSNLADGIFASEMFYLNAHAAATNHDVQRYYGNLKAFTGVTDANSERAGDIYHLLITNGYPAPILHVATDPTATTATISIIKDTPGLIYTPESRADLLNSTWQSMFPDTYETNNFWSTSFGLDPNASQSFYHVVTIPAFGQSPVWPQ
jgi:hypothetical protein